MIAHSVKGLLLLPWAMSIQEETLGGGGSPGSWGWQRVAGYK